MPANIVKCVWEMSRMTSLIRSKLSDMSISTMCRTFEAAIRILHSFRFHSYPFCVIFIFLFAFTQHFTTTLLSPTVISSHPPSSRSLLLCQLTNNSNLLSYSFNFACWKVYSRFLTEWPNQLSHCYSRWKKKT